jgi:hypothetical protein
LEDLLGLIDRSNFQSPDWRARLTETTASRGLDVAVALAETDGSDLMEGLYIKVEEQGRVVERYKYVRATFCNTIRDSGTHWLRRPIIPNGLREDVDLFGGTP